VTDAEISALADPQAADFAPAELAALEAARLISLTVPDAEIRPELRRSLEQFYSRAELLEILMVCAVLTGMAKLLFAMGWGEHEESGEREEEER